MGINDKLNVAMVGFGGRGASFKAAFAADCPAVIHAVCDINELLLDESQQSMGAAEKYLDYETMLDKSDIDAVVIATPVSLHVSQSIMALERGIHVMSEVPAGTSIAECRKLVETCHSSMGIYMMAENANYFRPNMIIKSLIDAGLFGEIYFAEAEYLHELKELLEITPWRKLLGNGISYPTHQLGPVMMWMENDRISSVSCVGSGHHYRDPQGNEYGMEDTSVMMAKTEMGRLIKVRMDLLSTRPHVTCTYSLQGTKGCYESDRTNMTNGRIWLEELCEDREKWMTLADIDEKYIPDIWKETPDAVKNAAGHEGSDYFVILGFIDAITGRSQSPIDIHKALDMTLPGLMSQESISRDGAWVEVPNSRSW